MTTTNPITGDKIMSKPSNEEYSKNWDRIFGDGFKATLTEQRANKTWLSKDFSQKDLEAMLKFAFIEGLETRNKHRMFAWPESMTLSLAKKTMTRGFDRRDWP